jgi:hypothetical protein
LTRWHKKQEELNMIKYDEPKVVEGPSILTQLFPSIFPPKAKKATAEEEAAAAAARAAEEEEERLGFGRAKALPPPGPELLAYRDFVIEVCDHVLVSGSAKIAR